MTPLEKARIRETAYCKNCVLVNGAFYCEVSGKLLHPYLLTSDGRCTKLNCEHRKAALEMSDYTIAHIKSRCKNV